MDLSNLSLFEKIRNYRKRVLEMERFLFEQPQEWPRFQAELSASLDSILHDILVYEKENINNNEAKVYKLKKLFARRLRKYFLRGDLIKRSFYKPHGYPGDFEIMEKIYANYPTAQGFDRLWDNYFLALGISEAVRIRKEDFKRIICEFIKERQGKSVKIMNLGCGSAREIQELLSENNNLFSNVSFDCYDHDKDALDYAKSLLNGNSHLRFFQKNALRLALTKDVRRELGQAYDLIYSAGLFDYFDNKIAAKLICNLRQSLNPGGMLAIANVRDKYSNPSAYWMEWVSDWNLIYRSEGEMLSLFLESGFSQDQIKIVLEKQKIVQYCLGYKGW